MKDDLGGNTGSMASPEAPAGLRPTGYDPGRLIEEARVCGARLDPLNAAMVRDLCDTIERLLATRNETA